MRDTKAYQSLPFNPALRDKAKALRKAGILHQALLRKKGFARAEKILRRAQQNGASPCALYASGWDSIWLLQERPSVRNYIDFIVDDRRAGEKHASDLDVISIAEAEKRRVRTIVINCAAHEPEMARLLEPLEGRGVHVHRLYSRL